MSVCDVFENTVLNLLVVGVVISVCGHLYIIIILNMAGFRTGQAGQLPRGPHNQGASTCLVTFYFLVF